MGNVPPSGSSDQPATAAEPPAKELATRVMSRLRREKRWFGQAEQVRDDLMRESKSRIPDKEARQRWVYGEIDRMYPPPSESLPNVTEVPIHIGNSDVSPYVPTKPISETQSDTGQIQGLGELPEDWPELPENAAMSAELAWVQANRLRVVTERPGRATIVDLRKAKRPAPSLAALGWLETSIRSYAKFLDAAVKVGGGEEEGEGAVMRRERKSVEEVKALLKQMEAAEGTCSRCGRPY